MNADYLARLRQMQAAAQGVAEFHGQAAAIAIRYPHRIEGSAAEEAGRTAGRHALTALALAEAIALAEGQP